MARVYRESDMDASVYGPNKYYLAGYRALFMGPESTAKAPAEAPAAAPRPRVPDADIPF
jgi:hypothetical protein